MQTAIVIVSVMMTQLMQMTTVHTRNSAIAEGPRDALVSRNSATTKHPI